jgi:hypothetical protein
MRSSRLVLALLAAALLSSAAPARAKPPGLTGLFPPGARQGTTVRVAASGSFDRWPVRGWVEGPGVTVEAASEKGGLWVTVAPDAPPGPRWVRLFDEEGASAPRPFFVGTLPETIEVEPNDEPGKAQAIDREAVVVNGKLGRSGDVDGFAVRLRKGRTLVVSVEANRRLGSPVDAVLEVVSPEGFVLAENHDDRGLDPQLVFRAPADGTYVVRTMGFPANPNTTIGFFGRESCVYRLTLTTLGFVDRTFPLAVTQGASTPVVAEGWNLPTPAPALELTPGWDDDPDGLAAARGGLAGAGGVRVVPVATVVEAEPNGPDRPQQVTAPVVVSGRIEPAGDADAFAFRASKGSALALRVESRALGLPLDPVLKVLDASGKVVAENDDAGKADPDPRLSFTPTADGTYRAVVRDLNGRGGPRHVYRLSIEPPAPEVRLKVAADRATLTPGKPLALKVELDRKGPSAGPVEVSAVELPPGVTAAGPATSAPTGDSAKSVTLTLQAGPEARPGPFRIAARIAGRDRPVFAEAPVEGLDTPTSRLWVHVTRTK